MKTKLSFFLMFTATLLSCTHTHIVRPTVSADYTSLNEQGLRQTATVTLENEQKLTAEKLRFAPDSTSWVDPHTEKVMTVPTAEISNIQFVNRGKGALKGLGIGFLAGASIGAAVGFASGKGESGGIGSISTEAHVVIGGLFGGGIGALLGLPVGAATARKDIYRTNLDSLESAPVVRK